MHDVNPTGQKTDGARYHQYQNTSDDSGFRKEHWEGQHGSTYHRIEQCEDGRYGRVLFFYHFFQRREPRKFSLFD